jgi:hypothetical protein
MNDEMMPPEEEGLDATEEIDPAVEDLIDQAKGLLYGDNFENMMKLFQTGGPQGFANAMATVVVGTLERLEADNGEQTNETLLMVAIGIVAMLATDLANGRVMEVDSDQVQLAIQASIGMWMKRNQDRVDIEGMQQEIAQGVQQGEGADILAQMGDQGMGQGQEMGQGMLAGGM